MPKRTSKNRPKEPTRSAPPSEGRQVDDPQSEFSVPQKWEENDAPATAKESSSTRGEERSQSGKERDGQSGQ